MATPDFEAEGLLEGLDKDARDARLELLGWLHKRGRSLEELRRAIDEDRLTLLPVEHVLSGNPKYTLEQMAEASGLTADQIERLYRANGLPLSPTDEPMFTDSHLEAARTFRSYLDAGLPMSDLMEASRVFGEAASRSAAAARELTARALARPGGTERDLGLGLAAVAGNLAEPTGQILGHLFAFHLQDQVRSAYIEQQAITTGRRGNTQEVAVCFADLVDFTQLGQGIAPEDLGGVADRLVEITSAVTNPPVALVKTIGDAVMLVAPAVGPLLTTALELVSAVDEEGEEFPPVRAGIAYGQAFTRWGDWYGPPVNLASRVCTTARPSTVLVAEPAKEEVEDDFAWSFAGARRLKGIEREVKLFRARPLDKDAELEQYE